MDMIENAEMLVDPSMPEAYKTLVRGVNQLAPLSEELTTALDENMQHGKQSRKSQMSAGGRTHNISVIRDVDPRLLLSSRYLSKGSRNPDDDPWGRGWDYLGNDEQSTESTLHSLLNTIEERYLPDIADTGSDDRLRRLFAMHILEPMIGYQ